MPNVAVRIFLLVTLWLTSGTITTSNALRTLTMASSSLSSVRIELFFKTTQQLQERVAVLSNRGVTRYNLVNKDAADALMDHVALVRAIQPTADVCVHCSLKYAKVKRGSVDQHFDKVQSFLRTVLATTSISPLPHVLMVSGSQPIKDWSTVEALQRLQPESLHNIMLPRMAVAYNPFFPTKVEQNQEWERLQQKLATGLVSKIYLQFGTDLRLLQQALERLQQEYNTVTVCGSVFMPTAKLIAQQRFRPWKGVYLSDAFLSGPVAARDTVVQILRLYRNHEVELLVEAPGVCTEKDLDLVQQLLHERDQDTFSEVRENEIENSSSVAAASTIVQSHKRLKVEPSVELAIADTPVDQNEEQQPVIVLFGSHDVRLTDNQALAQALLHHSCILPVFLWEPDQPKWGVRGALQVVLKDALEHLDTSLQTFGFSLVCRNTEDCVQELRQLVEITGALAVYWNRQMTPEGRTLDARRVRAMEKLGVAVVPCQSSLLYDIEQLDLATGFQGGHWGTLMPFLRACEKQLGTPPRPIPSQEQLERARPLYKTPKSVSIAELEMAVMPPNTKWNEPILARFRMTEEAARTRLDWFFENGLSRYENDRSRADLDHATSQLSAHLRIGTLSPLELYWRSEDSLLSKEAKKTFWRRLIWRDLAYFQLFSFPQMRDRSIREHYDNAEWVTGDEEKRRLLAWQKGQTGYPLVDAGMRELHSTGWMSQSVRMVVAAFLTEYLRVHWVKGAEWFHETLVDADSAINPMMWQNAGRSGIDQWNFVPSPETASQDGTGDYTRQWVPELARLSKQTLHRPWQAAKDELVQAGVVLGETYPSRVVDNLKAEHDKTVTSVLKMRRESQDKNDGRGYDLITLPDGQETVVFTRKGYRIDRRGQVMEPQQASKSSAPKRSKGRRGRRS